MDSPDTDIEDDLLRKLVNAAAANDAQTVRELARKVDINQGPKGDCNALIAAVEAGNADMIQLLAQLGADVNREDEFTGCTPLFDAIHLMWDIVSGRHRQPNDRIVKLLLQLGANPDQKCSNGHSPRDIASSPSLKESGWQLPDA